jgi:catechol 2,3-dioxygenase-like lactoylglutathione lyase family enzyme
LGYLRGQPDYVMLQRLIELGADLEATDDKGRTPLAVAMLRGDREAARLLKAAGAKEPPAPDDNAARFPEQIAATATSVKKAVPMFSVRDMRATVRWYESIGFTVHDRYEDGGELMFARLAFGDGEFTLSPGGTNGPRDVSLWFFTDRVRDIYALLKERQLASAIEVRFQEDLYEPFYGGRQFSILDNNGLHLIFWQPEWLAPRS